MQKLIFEPHNLHGQTIDGEDMPFGYISAIQESGNRLPVFELSTVFGPMPGFDRPALARSMAEAPAMVAALRDAAEELQAWRYKFHPSEWPDKPVVHTATRDKIRAILSRIDGAGEALPDAPAPAPAPTARAKRTAAHERAIRRAWQERKARRAARFNHELKRDQLDNANRSVTYWRELAEAETLRANDTARELNTANESLALGRAEMAVIAPMLAKYADRRRKADQRARRMIAAARVTHAESINRMAAQARTAIDASQAELARLKRDMADPMQPERASDIARLVGERDTARTALAAMAARAERAEQTVNAMADRFEGLVSRVTRAEAALRQSQAA